MKGQESNSEPIREIAGGCGTTQSNHSRKWDDTQKTALWSSVCAGCVSVVMFRDDEIAAPQIEYMFDFSL